MTIREVDRLPVFCSHVHIRDQFTPICDDNGEPIGALCLECGNDQATYKAAHARALAHQAEARELAEYVRTQEARHATRRKEAQRRAGNMSREQLADLLTTYGFQVYDHETLADLREAVIVNIEDGTISAQDVPQD